MKEKETYILMNGDTPCLSFPKDFKTYTVLNNEMLPYALKDCIDRVSPIRGLFMLQDYLSERVLDPGRENAKAILNITNLPQSSEISDRLRIVFTCRGLKMEDNFWLKQNQENLSFSDVCLRTRPISEKSFEVAICGYHILAKREELIADLATGGKSAKFWNHDQGKLYLWKLEEDYGPDAYMRERVSKIVQKAGGNAITYKLRKRAGKSFSVAECFTSDKVSLVKASELEDYFKNNADINNGRTLMEYIDENWKKEFANMVVVDYVFSNSRRYTDQFGFFVDNDTQELTFAPLYNFGYALFESFLYEELELCDLDKETYCATGTPFLQTLQKYAPYATVNFERVQVLTKLCQTRWKKVKEIKLPIYIYSENESEEEDYGSSL